MDKTTTYYQKSLLINFTIFTEKRSITITFDLIGSNSLLFLVKILQYTMSIRPFSAFVCAGHCQDQTARRVEKRGEGI